MKILPSIPVKPGDFTSRKDKIPFFKRPPLLIAVMCVFALLTPIIIIKGGIAGAVVAILPIFAIPILYGVVVYPVFGMICLLVGAYSLMWIMKMDLTSYPLGTVMDSLELLLFIGMLLNQRKRTDWTFMKSPISTIILIWIFYNLLQILNPVAESRLAWMYTIRSFAMVMLMYFVFMYHIRTVQLVRLMIKVWLGLSLFAAIYAFKQEYIGFFAFEERGLQDPQIISLYFIYGQWRKFSIFNDPVVYSYNMVISSLVCIALVWGKTLSLKKKIILGIMALVFLKAMLFSGTRGAYVLVPFALAIFIVMTFTKKMIPFATFAVLSFIVVLKVPTGNPAIQRFQSAFAPSNDDSYKVRKMNQKRIQPYILSHPFGGGLGATGAWGNRFAPNSFLAKFPPDSGYMRVAVELGWVGLLIFCTFIFIVLRTGIRNFYLIKDPELKAYSLAMLLVLFALMLGNYPQEALVQFPSNIMFYLVIALIGVTYKLDVEKRTKMPAANLIQPPNSNAA